MSIYNKIDEIVEKIKSNPDFAASFVSDPVKVVEPFLEVDLTDTAKETVISIIEKRLNENYFIESFMENAPDTNEDETS